MKYNFRTYPCSLVTGGQWCRLGVSALFLLFIIGKIKWFLFDFIHTNSPANPTTPANLLGQFGNVLNNSSISMDDQKLIDAVKKLLIPPSTRPYNFYNSDHMSKNVNPSAGQVQAVEDILRGFGGDGFFLDCGANDGEWFSNTIWLERTLGWKGLLIEADPSAFTKLNSKNRNAWCGHFCLSSVPYPKIVFWELSRSLFSYHNDFQLPFYQDKTLGAIGSGLIQSEQYFAESAVNVQCIPLYTILLAVGRTTVDFFSLDVEGSELDILKTIPFDKVIFKVITIEHVVLREGKLGLRSFMESKGYVFYRTVVDSGFIAGDSIFVHSSVELTAEQKARIGEEDSELQRPSRG